MTSDAEGSECRCRFAERVEMKRLSSESKGIGVIGHDGARWDLNHNSFGSPVRQIHREKDEWLDLRGWKRCILTSSLRLIRPSPVRSNTTSKGGSPDGGVNTVSMRSS